VSDHFTAAVRQWLQPLLVACRPLGCCYFCHARASSHSDLCDACAAHLPSLAGSQSSRAVRRAVCLRCGRLVAQAGWVATCDACNTSSPFSAQVAAFRYAWPIDGLLQAWRARGFDHARDLAMGVGHQLGIVCRPDWATRIVNTGSLAAHSRTERQWLIRGAFAVDAAVADQHIAIVDDIFTTGATAGELARELYDTGAASVAVWTLARTVVDD